MWAAKRLRHWIDSDPDFFGSGAARRVNEVIGIADLRNEMLHAIALVLSTSVPECGCATE